MKKLFSIIAALALVITLTACTEDLQPKVTDLETKIATLEAQISTLEGEKDVLTTDLTSATESNTSKDGVIAEQIIDIEELEEDIQFLQEHVAELQGQLFDKVITISVKSVDGTVETSTIGVNDDYEGTVFDLLDASFEVTATVSQYGHYITGLEDLQPTNGAYISFTKNGVASMVGVDTATYDDGDEFSFELVWWDMTEKAVSDGIDLFLENQASNYVNATTIDYSVMAALAQLGVVEEYVTDAEVQAYVDGLDITTATGYFKAIVILEAAGLDATTLYSDLNAIAAPAVFGGTGYQLQAFNVNTTTTDFSAFETAALTNLASSGNTPVDLGVDSGAITVLALSNYKEETGVDSLIGDWVSYIKTNQTENGAILDKDFGWGASENGATLAQAVVGLVSVGVNPKGGDTTMADMTKLNYDLVNRLCEYQNADGSFNWLLEDTEPNLGFTTPQGFLALVTYYEFSNSYGTATNPYNFE